MIVARLVPRTGLAGWSVPHPEWPLAALAMLAWAALLAVEGGAGHGGHQLSSPFSWVQGQGHWMLMAAAMMIPPALPMARIVARNSKRRRQRRAMFLFAGSSLAVWAAAGLVAVTAAALPLHGGLTGASLLVAAGWELTPFKRRALKSCHRMVPLPPDGRRADRACVKLGLDYGGSCFKASWALMLPMALGASTGLMVLLAAVAVAEEVVRKGYRLSPAAAVVLTATGLMVLVLG